MLDVVCMAVLLRSLFVSFCLEQQQRIDQELSEPVFLHITCSLCSKMVEQVLSRFSLF